MKKILSILLTMGIVAVFAWSCKDDDGKLDGITLQLDKTSETIFVGGSTAIEILAGNGGYTVKSSDEGVVTASLTGTTVTLTAVDEGFAEVFVTDNTKRSVLIEVSVTYTVPTKACFIWDGQETEFEKPGCHGLTILSSGIALTDLTSTDQEQIYVSWTGGFSLGSKTKGSLMIARPEQDASVITLSKVRVVKSDAQGDYVVFSDGIRNGEVFFVR